MPTMNISLTPELLKLVKDKVKSGMYNNASEFVREAVRQYETNRDYLREVKIARLKEVLAIGLAQAEAGQVSEYPMEELMSDIRAVRKKRKK